VELNGVLQENRRTTLCANCATDLQPGARYCHHCGQPAGGESQATDAPESKSVASGNLLRLGPRQYLAQVTEHGQRLISERRFVTTLFCDVVGSTSMAERLDPEEITALMNSAFMEMMDPVHRYEGTLARLMGDGVLCLFGAPISHEDDALRACRAATEIMPRIASMSRTVNEQYGIPSFEVRIGISTGLAVVGEVGTDLRSEYTAMGDSVNLAARLQHAATPGEILVCDDTWRLVNQDFGCRNSRTLQVRGRSKEAKVYSLDYQKGVLERQRDNDSQPALVGRAKELAEFREALLRLNSERGGILTIHGRAGVGKTRLLREAQKTIPEDTCWIEATCMAYMQTSSYWVTRELVCRLLKPGRDQDDTDLMSSLRNFTSRALAQRVEDNAQCTESAAQHAAVSMCAVIGKLLQADLNERETSFIEVLSAESLNQRIIVEVVELVRLRAKSQKLVLVLEDIQWIDPESLLVLQAMVRKVCSQAVLLVLVSRDDCRQFTDQIVETASENSLSVTELQLGGLSPAESQELSGSLLRGMKLPEELVERVVAIAEGNAFFLQEMLRSLTDSVAAGGSEDELSQGASMTSVSVPQTVQAAILSRVDRLSARDRLVLQTAAVLGRVFRLNLLVSMLAPTLSVALISESLCTLLQRSFLSVDNCSRSSVKSRCHCIEGDGTIRLPELRNCCEQCPQCELYFAHALLQEVVYETLLYSKRRELHAQSAKALEAIAGRESERHAMLLAFHYDRGAQREQAIRCYLLAARQAADMFSLDSALSAYRRALELSKEAKAETDAGLLASIYEGIGDVYLLRGDYQDALSNFDEAETLVQSKLRIGGLRCKRGRLLLRWGKYDDARHAFEMALESMTDNFEPRLAGKIYADLSLTYFHLNDLEIAEELGNLALVLERDTEDQTGIAQACNHLGVILTRKGDWEEAEAYFGECARIGVESGDTYGLAACYNNWGLLALEQQNWSAASERFEKSRELFEMVDNRHGLARVYDNLSHAAFCQGDETRAEEYLTKAVAILTEIGVDGENFQPELWQSGAW
jgi:class 3 adenylate cyclase/tetratricopeptide (TPR) repeat protein